MPRHSSRNDSTLRWDWKADKVRCSAMTPFMLLQSHTALPSHLTAAIKATYQRDAVEKGHQDSEAQAPLPAYHLCSCIVEWRTQARTRDWHAYTDAHDERFAGRAQHQHATVVFWATWLCLEGAMFASRRSLDVFADRGCQDRRSFACKDSEPPIAYPKGARTVTNEECLSFDTFL